MSHSTRSNGERNEFSQLAFFQIRCCALADVTLSSEVREEVISQKRAYLWQKQNLTQIERKSTGGN